MTTLLIVGDTFRTPELRHEVPLGVPDGGYENLTTFPYELEL